jgi:hypothetical protein
MVKLTKAKLFNTQYESYSSDSEEDDVLPKVQTTAWVAYSVSHRVLAVVKNSCALI